MNIVYSIWNNGICYGRYEKEVYANMVAEAYMREGMKMEVECNFVCNRKYEVEEQIRKLKGWKGGNYRKVLR